MQWKSRTFVLFAGLLALILALGAPLSALGGRVALPAPQAGEGPGYEALVAGLEARGYTVAEDGRMRSMLLGGAGALIWVDDQPVEVFESDNPRVFGYLSRVLEANRGFLMAQLPGTVEAPTLWIGERMLVAYFGRQAGLVADLSDLLGSQPLAAAPAQPEIEPQEEPAPEPEAPESPFAEPADITDTLSVIEALAAEQVTIEPLGRVDLPIIQAEGQAYRVNGQQVLLFEAPSEAALQQTLAGLEANLDLILAQIPAEMGRANAWTRGRVLAVYLGEDETTVTLLNRLFGEPLTAGTPYEAGPEEQEETAQSQSFLPLTGNSWGGVETEALPDTGPAAITGTQALVAEFIAGGGEVLTQGRFTTPFLAVEAEAFLVDGEQLLVFEAPDPASLENAIRALNANLEALRNQFPLALRQPNAWAQGRLLVIYPGADPAMMDLLDRLLGGRLVLEALQPAPAEEPVEEPPAGEMPPIGDTEPGEPTGEQDPSADPVSAVDQARRYLAERLGIPAGEVGIAVIQPVTWSDACLGLTVLDRACAQVETPGWQIVLSYDGLRYDFRADRTGDLVISAFDGTVLEQP